MTYVLTTPPGSGSHTFKLILETILNCEGKSLKSDSGIGHLFLKASHKDFFLKKLNLNFLRKKEKLILGHILPLEYNMNLLNEYFKIEHYLISYRNIYDQLNYYYKWHKYNHKGPIGFTDREKFNIGKNFSQSDFSIDLNLIIVLFFYKQWFYLIQNNLVENFTLFSFDEIISKNNVFISKLKQIFKNYDIKEEIHDAKKNVYKKEKFNIHPRHKNMIEEFISNNNDVDFSLILK